MKKEEELLSVAEEELESKSKEVQKEKDEDSQTKCAAAMSELFLKQVLNQGSKKFDLYRRKCVVEKKKLFDESLRQYGEVPGGLLGVVRC